MNLSISPVEEDIDFDLVIAACGYETRARYMLECREVRAPKMVAIGYGHGHELAFEDNKKAFIDGGFEFADIDDDSFETYIEVLIREVREREPRRISVLLDISCFSRLRLALVLEALTASGAFVLDVFYSLAAFCAPNDKEPKSQYLCPVTDYFSGWTGDAGNAVVLISGLGYEQMMALGIIEHIDPYESWLFFPRSPIPAYDEAVEKANSLLLREVPASNVLGYPVMDGTVLLRKMLSLVNSLRQNYRCIVMPLGPKVFAFCALLAGCVYRDISVWRASAGRHYKLKDRLPSEHIATFRVRLDMDEDVPGEAGGDDLNFVRSQVA